MYSCRVNKSGSTFLTHEHSSVDFCKLLNEKGFYGTQPIFFVVQMYQVVAIQVADLNFIILMPIAYYCVRIVVFVDSMCCTECD